jgi:hypothetical protein
MFDNKFGGLSPAFFKVIDNPTRSRAPCVDKQAATTAVDETKPWQFVTSRQSEANLGSRRETKPRQSVTSRQSEANLGSRRETKPRQSVTSQQNEGKAITAAVARRTHGNL